MAQMGGHDRSPRDLEEEYDASSDGVSLEGGTYYQGGQGATLGSVGYDAVRGCATFGTQAGKLYSSQADGKQLRGCSTADGQYTLAGQSVCHY